jgi:hypothetical protein
MKKWPPIRKFMVARALESAATLNEILHQLTMKEIMKALDLEADSQRRRSIISTLARRAARLQRQEFIQQLSEKYDAPFIVEDSE